MVKGKKVKSIKEGKLADFRLKQITEDERIILCQLLELSEERVAQENVL